MRWKITCIRTGTIASWKNNPSLSCRLLSPWTGSRDADRSGSVSPRTPVPAISRGASCVPHWAPGCRRGCHSGQRSANLPCKVPAVGASLCSCWTRRMFHKFNVLLLLQKIMESGTSSHEKRPAFAESEDLLNTVKGALCSWGWLVYMEISNNDYVCIITITIFVNLFFFLETT